MKIIQTIIFLIAVFKMFGQAKSDTLYFGAKKFPLEKTKAFFDFSQKGPVHLPSEYKEIPFKGSKDEIQFKYTNISDTTIAVELDEDDNEITILTWNFSCDTSKNRVYYLTSLVDTLRLSFDELENIIPYIKSNNKKYFFCAATFDVIRHSKIKRYIFYQKPDGISFSFWSSYDSSYKKELINSSILILRDLYYKKGKETYYLDRKLVIVPKKIGTN